MLLTVSGSSCSGKTTVMRSCASLDGVAVYDFDEIGVPAKADAGWRQRSMDRWLRRVLDCQDDGLDVMLLGQSPLGEVLASPLAVHLNGIAPCLLDVGDDERLRRLAGRRSNGFAPGAEAPAAQRSLVAWGRWHRGHAADPRYRPEVITANGWERMAWHRWDRWTRHDPRWKVTVVDTTGRTVAETTEELQRWAVAARADEASGRLSLRQGWADS